MVKNHIVLICQWVIEYLVHVYRDKTELIESILKAVNGRSLNASQIIITHFYHTHK